MTGDQQVLFIMRGALASVPEEEQARVLACLKKLKAIVEEYGDEGKFACGLLGAELAAET